MTVDLLVNIGMPDYSLKHLAEKYTIHYWPDRRDHDRLLRDPVLATIRAVQTNGSYGLAGRFIEAMPKLEIICAIGAGVEGIDLEAARARGIVVTNGAGTNAPSVADQAWALLLAAMRRVAWCDRGIREGRWQEVRLSSMPIPTGKKLGIFGLGHVGKEVAKRGERGFDMEVGYHNRRPRQEVDYRYFPSLEALASWCDVLVVAAPGGPATRHVVGREVLDALGPEGFLVNVGRGSVVDAAALADALRAERIAGAGLDVLEGEPAIPPDFLALERLVMSPHVGGLAPESIRAMVHRLRDNLDAHFAGRPVLSPITDDEATAGPTGDERAPCP